MAQAPVLHNLGPPSCAEFQDAFRRGTWNEVVRDDRRFAKALSFPVVQDPEAPPIRPERHVENSIATMRKRLTVALARSLYRCPCCHRSCRNPDMPGNIRSG